MTYKTRSNTFIAIAHPIAAVLILLLALASCTPGATTPPADVSSAIERYVNVDEGVGYGRKLSTNWSIRNSQKAPSPQNQHRFQNTAEEAWCIVISPAIPISGSSEVKNFLAYRIGLSWFVVSSYAEGGLTSFTNVGCSNYDPINEF